MSKDMKCKICNTENRDTAKFCNECGAKLETQLKSCTNKDCPDYGNAILPAEAKFCPRCGKPIEGAREGSNNSIQGHEYVDLGLSVKWATCNVGANYPEEYGDYFAWGETYTKEVYIEDTSDTFDIGMDDISGDPDYDAARANWGGSWRLPTKAEMEELEDKCTWTWTSQSGVKGYKVTGPNGNSIFLPAAGYCLDSSRINVGECGDYWSSTPYESNTSYVYGLNFCSAYHFVHRHYRSDGHTVRPVVDYLEVSSSMFIWNIPD